MKKMYVRMQPKRCRLRETFIDYYPANDISLHKRLEKMGKYDEETFEEAKRKMKQELGL